MCLKDEASDATCTERTLLVLTDVVAAKVLARLSSSASTASLLSFRFTMSSSGTGTNGSSVSATTCTSKLFLFCALRRLLSNYRNGLFCAVCSIASVWREVHQWFVCLLLHRKQENISLMNEMGPLEIIHSVELVAYL